MGYFLSSLFDLDNSGQKIQRFIKINYIVWVTLTTIAGFGVSIFFAIEEDLTYLFFLAPFAGIVSFFVGWAIFWPSTIFLYGFGELISNSESLPLIGYRQSQKYQPPYNKEYEKKPQETPKIVELEYNKNTQEINIQKEELKNEEKIIKPVYKMPKPIPTLEERLRYALKYSTDDGMISYLKGIENDKIKEILALPSEEIRQAVTDLLNSEH